nr:hypothetical protein [uncultured Carboxylicivirga sp.]
MKREIGIWLNTNKAILIDLQNSMHTTKTIESNIESRNRFPGEGKNYSRLGAMQVNPSKRTTNRKKHQLHHYFKEIMQNIEDASNIFILGPSETKKLLGKELKNQHLFQNKVIQTENADKMTHKQLIAKIKDHFKATRS